MVGAGTMGARIARLAEASGLRTVLHDPHVPEHADASGLDGCALIIEAVPEDFALKREVLAGLPRDAVLATNTSSLSVTEIAAGVPDPERVVGLHFFNPPERMRLVELVAGAVSSPAALARARAIAEAMGRHVIDAPDVPGFVVNRVNRPFSLEGLKLLEEGVADVETIDGVLQDAAGFRMGPFALMDLVGIDVNHAVAQSMYARSYGEPRYRPSPLAARKVAAGTLGHKTGEGWYVHRPSMPRGTAMPDPGGGDGRPVRVLGDEPLAREMRAALDAAGFADGDGWLTVTFGPPADGPRLRIVRDHFLAVADPDAAGFHALAPLAGARLVELTATPRTDPAALGRAEAMIAALGRLSVRVGDVPGLISGRVVCQLINEAYFAGGDRADIDTAMKLGVAHPRGPFAWAEAIGLPVVVATLDGLRRALGEERYRVAPALRRAASVA